MELIEARVPVHNNWERTQLFLDMWEAQTVKVPLSFDCDHCTDGTPERLKQAGYPYRVYQERQYFNPMLNRAIEECEAEFLMFLGNDIQFRPHFCERVVEAIEEPPPDIIQPRDMGYCTTGAICGWCIIIRVEAFRSMPPIPDDLRFWFGDDWLNWWAKPRLRAVKGDFRVTHKTSDTLKKYPIDHVIDSDMSAFLKNHQHIAPHKVPLVERALQK